MPRTCLALNEVYVILFVQISLIVIDSRAKFMIDICIEIPFTDKRCHKAAQKRQKEHQQEHEELQQNIPTKKSQDNITTYCCCQAKGASITDLPYRKGYF